MSDPGKYYEEKRIRANVWRDVCRMIGRTMDTYHPSSETYKALEQLLNRSRRRLDLNEYVGD